MRIKKGYPITAIALLALNFCCILSHAQVKKIGTPAIINYTVKEYKAEQQNFNIFQDRRGIMYFANTNGVLQFDGHSWSLMEMPNKLCTRRIVSDKNDKIYVGGSNEFGYLEADKRGKLNYISLLKRIPKEYRYFRDVFGIDIKQDTIILYTSYYLFTITPDTVKVIKSDNSCFQTGNFKNKSYVFIKGGKLYSIENSTLKLVPESEIFNGCQNVKFVKWTDSIALVNDSKNLFLYDGKHFQKLPTKLNVLYPDIKIKDLISISANQYAIATAENGIFIIDKEGFIIQHLTKDNGLNSNTVYRLYLDKHKNLWAALNQGISLILLNSPFFYYPNSLPLDSKVSIGAVYSNRLYIGEEPYIYFTDWNISLNKYGSKFTKMNVPSYQYWFLFPFDNKLFCGYDAGLVIISPDNSFDIIKSKNTIAAISTIPGKTDELMMCSSNELFVLNKVQNKWLIKNTISGYKGFFKSFCIDNEKNIWTVSLDRGLVCIKTNDACDSIIKTELYTTTNGLASIYDCSVYVVDGKVYAQSANKIYLFDKIGKSFKPIYEDSDDKEIMILKWNHRDTIWILAKPGLAKLIRHNDGNYAKISKPYSNIKDYKSITDIIHVNDQNLLILKENMMEFHELNNRNSIDNNFNTLLRKITLINTDSCIFEDNIAKALEIQNKLVKLKKKENSLRFVFSATFYEDAKDMEYSYKLLGYDNNWSAWGKENSKDYTNLKEGEYVFKIRSRNSYLELGKEDIFHFIILSPWYRTSWAYLLYSVFIIISVLLLILIFIKRKQIKYIKREKDFKINMFPNTSEEIKIPLSINTIPMPVTFIDKAIEVINKNISNIEFDVNSLAKELNLSRSALFRKFRELDNVTPNEIIQEIRLKKSMELIQQSDLTIAEIAYMVGFDDARYFSTCFKKYFGKTPVEFKNS